MLSHFQPGALATNEDGGMQSFLGLGVAEPQIDSRCTRQSEHPKNRYTACRYCRLYGKKRSRPVGALISQLIHVVHIYDMYLRMHIRRTSTKGQRSVNLRLFQ